MKRLVAVLLLTLSACSGLSHDEAARLDAGLQTYVRLVPLRPSMDVAELTSHELLGSSLLATTGRLSGRVK